jgi:transposase
MIQSDQATDLEAPVGADATSCYAETIVDLPGFVVLAAGEYGGELELLVETVDTVVHCVQCGGRARAHDRREHLLRDVPIGGRATVLVWWKRIWRCPQPDCAVRTWTERSPLGAPRESLTRRAKAWVTRRVGADGESVAGVARTLGVGWWSVMRAVIETGKPLVDDPARLAGVAGLGVDEHAWQRANAYRHTQYATGVVGLRPGRPARLLEVVPGRSGGVYADWLAARPQAWREQIRIAALDPFRGYLNALREHLPTAAHVLDAFHVTALGMKALDEVRRRVQQDTLHRRGHKGDPLYQVRRVLRRRADRLTDSAAARLEAALAAGDPDGEVTVAWWAAQQLCLAYAKTDLAAARGHADALIDQLLDCPVPEVARLGRTLAMWRPEFLAYFDTDRASNGPTEAVNLLVEKIRRIGHGYRRFDHYRLRLLLHCGIEWPNLSPPRIRRRRPRFVA